MSRSKIFTGVLVFCVVVLPAIAYADSVIVNQDGSEDYTTISAALADSVVHDIIVYPGTYHENITISRPVTLRSYDGPNLTVIDGSGNAAIPSVRIASYTQGISLEGFRITGGYQGVKIDDGTSVEVANCVIDSNAHEGIYVLFEGHEPYTSARIANNVIINNMGAGIFLDQSYGSFSYSWILNNIVVGNHGYGISTNASNNPERVSVAYTCLYQNVPSNINGSIPIGTGMKTDLDPKFVGAYTNDVRLQSTSPCVNTGSTDATSNDPDGTRNDMGAFGGPYAATFFESPTDGPIVRDVSTNPASVPQGATFSIQATVAVR